MSIPIGRQPTVVTMDDEFEQYLNEKANKLAEKPCSSIKEALKAQADAAIDKTRSSNGSKDVCKKITHSSIDTCVDFSAKKAISNLISNVRQSSQQ